jgi:hypothetical protein
MMKNGAEKRLNVSSPDNFQQDGNDCYHQQNMNYSSCVVTSKKANGPDNY